jgi:hypothetical protein
MNATETIPSLCSDPAYQNLEGMLSTSVRDPTKLIMDTMGSHPAAKGTYGVNITTQTVCGEQHFIRINLSFTV